MANQPSNVEPIQRRIPFTIDGQPTPPTTSVSAPRRYCSSPVWILLRSISEN